MGRRRKAKCEGNICPHCNIEMEYENGENGELTEFWWECKECGRSYDENRNDITEYEFMDIK